MFNYWLTWIMVALFKTALLTGCIIGAIGGCISTEHRLLAILFIPLAIFFLHDYIYQILVPFIGGVGWRLHKPSDTPVYMGLAPSYKEARAEISKGHCIIWG